MSETGTPNKGYNERLSIYYVVGYVCIKSLGLDYQSRQFAIAYEKPIVWFNNAWLLSSLQAFE